MSLITFIKKLFSSDLTFKYQPSQGWVKQMNNLSEETKQQNALLYQKAIDLLYTIDLLNPLQTVEQTALIKLQAAAENGDINAMEKLADEYNNGRIATKHAYKKVLQWYLRAASLGSHTAATKIGELFQLNTHPKIKQNLTKALEWYQKAQQIDPNAMYRIGFIHQQGLGITIDTQQAKQWYEKAIILNHTNSMIELGNIYIKEMNYITAKNYFQQAYDLMNPRAEGALNKLTLYENLDSFPQLLNQAEQGDADALCKIGHYYYLGIGREIDYCKAASYYYQALERQHAEATYHLGALVNLGYAKIQFEGQKNFADQSIASEACFKLALKYKHPAALFEEGMRYMLADNKTSAGIDKGIGLLQEAAQAKHIPSISLLRTLTLEGMPSYMVLDPTITEPEKEVYWVNSFEGEKTESNLTRFIKQQLALQDQLLVHKEFSTVNQQAKQDDLQAMLFLGMMYGAGVQVEKDSQQAFEWYFKAAHAGHVEAMYRLGMLQLTNYELDEDNNITNQLFWLHRAADLGHTLAERIANIVMLQINSFA